MYEKSKIVTGKENLKKSQILLYIFFTQRKSKYVYVNSLTLHPIPQLNPPMQWFAFDALILTSFEFNIFFVVLNLD